MAIILLLFAPCSEDSLPQGGPGVGLSMSNVQ